MSNIEQLNKRVDKLDSDINGNGGPGLKATVIRLDTHVEKFDGTIADLTTAVRGLVRFMDETRGKDKIKAQMASTIKWLVGTLISLSIALITIVITIIL